MNRQTHLKSAYALVAVAIGCAPINEAYEAPIGQVSNAGGATTGSCTPDRIISFYAITDTSTPAWSSNLRFPCGLRYYGSEFSAVNPSCPLGTPNAISLPVTPLPPNPPATTPNGGQPAMPVTGLTCLERTGTFPLSGQTMRAYLLVMPASQLRAAAQANAVIAAWGQRWNRRFIAGSGTSLGSYVRDTVDRHRAVVFYRAGITGRWTDEVQYGANHFRWTTTDQVSACTSDGNAYPGPYDASRTDSIKPWSQVRYVTCSPQQNIFDARPALSTTGVNPDYESYSLNGRLGDYLATVFNITPTPSNEALGSIFTAFTTPDTTQ